MILSVHVQSVLLTSGAHPSDGTKGVNDSSGDYTAQSSIIVDTLPVNTAISFSVPPQIYAHAPPTRKPTANDMQKDRFRYRSEKWARLASGCAGPSLRARHLCCCAWSFPTCGQQGSSPCAVQASRCGGFPCCKAWALERKVSCGGVRPYLLHGVWDLGSQVSDQGSNPGIDRWTLKHWTTRHVQNEPDFWPQSRGICHQGLHWWQGGLYYRLVDQWLKTTFFLNFLPFLPSWDQTPQSPHLREWCSEPQLPFQHEQSLQLWPR